MSTKPNVKGERRRKPAWLGLGLAGLWKKETQDLISILSTKPNQIEFVGLEKVRGKEEEEKKEKIMTLPGQPAWFGLVDNIQRTVTQGCVAPVNSPRYQACVVILHTSVIIH